MKKALFYGILASFFFAFTFILNRSMNLAGGYWLWSACLRYLFTLPMMVLMLAREKGAAAEVLGEIRRRPGSWFLWSTVGFGLFYAPLTFGSVFGESWLAAATWQLTIVAGVVLTPLFGKKIPFKNLVHVHPGGDIPHAGAAHGADGREDGVPYPGSHTGGRIFLSPGKPEDDGALPGFHDNHWEGVWYDNLQHAILAAAVRVCRSAHRNAGKGPGPSVCLRGLVLRRHCHGPVL